MLATPKKATTIKSRTENLVQKPPMFMARMISGLFSCQLKAVVAPGGDLGGQLFCLGYVLQADLDGIYHIPFISKIAGGLQRDKDHHLIQRRAGKKDSGDS